MSEEIEPRPGAATLTDVARRAGVSLATASRVLNGSSRSVGEGLAQRVLAAADELSYSPHGPAQAMARGHTMSIGMIAPDIADPFFTQLSAGATDAAGRHSLMLSMAVHRGDPALEVQQVRAFRAQRVRGLVVAGSRLLGENPTGLLQALGDLPAVIVGQPVGEVPTVRFANQEGAAALASSLVDLGYRRTIILAGPEHHLTSSERVLGFSQVVEAAGLEHELVRDEFSRDGGHAAMTRVLDRVRGARVPTCVFAVTDMMALGAITALHEAGVVAGRDVGVAGFNDLPVLADLRPGLTTVRLPLREAGAAAVEALLDGAVHEQSFAGEVIIRDSTPAH